MRFKIEKVVIQNERILEGDVGGKSIRLDVYAAETGKIYDLEMQTTNPTDLCERSRYYQALMDVDCLDSGKLYSELPENFVVFICLKDPFNRNLPCYTFTNRCHETADLELNDRTYKLFYNASSYEAEPDAKIREFLKYLVTNRSDGAFSEDLQNRVAAARKNAQWRHSYMTWERYGNEQRAEGRAEGERIGEERGRLETARLLIEKYHIPLEQACADLGISPSLLKPENCLNANV